MCGKEEDWSQELRQIELGQLLDKGLRNGNADVGTRKIAACNNKEKL
jgi:hypothetical protein